MKAGPRRRFLARFISGALFETNFFDVYAHTPVPRAQSSNRVSVFRALPLSRSRLIIPRFHLPQFLQLVSLSPSLFSFSSRSLRRRSSLLFSVNTIHRSRPHCTPFTKHGNHPHPTCTTCAPRAPDHGTATRTCHRLCARPQPVLLPAFLPP